ncbi:285_t:CDS:2, partial [Acaulospora colombiana]
AGAAIKLFTSLGECQEPIPGPEGGNWFKIAYKNEWEAARAVRKNGELINGQWMTNEGKELWSSQNAAAPPTSVEEDAAQVTARTNVIGRPVRLEPSSTAYKATPGGVINPAGGEDWASAHTANKTNQRPGLFGLIGF